MDIKNPAFVTSLGLVALVLGLTGWYMATHPAPTPYVPEAPAAGIESDTPFRIAEDKEYYSIDVSYPTDITFPLSSRSDAGAEAERVMKAWIDTNIAQFKAYAGENEAAIADFVAEGEEVPASLASSYLLVTYDKKAGPRTLTYLFSSASYTGGAHGLEVPVSFTFDRTTGAAVELADLFLPNSRHLARLSEIASREVPGIVGDYANPEFILSGTAPEAQNFSTFYLTDTRLVILFPPYQVAPYVVGTVSLPIELSSLSDILKPEYRAE